MIFTRLVNGRKWEGRSVITIIMDSWQQWRRSDVAASCQLRGAESWLPAVGRPHQRTTSFQKTCSCRRITSPKPRMSQTRSTPALSIPRFLFPVSRSPLRIAVSPATPATPATPAPATLLLLLHSYRDFVSRHVSCHSSNLYPNTVAIAKSARTRFQPLDWSLARLAFTTIHHLSASPPFLTFSITDEPKISIHKRRKKSPLHCYETYGRPFGMETY